MIFHIPILTIVVAGTRCWNSYGVFFYILNLLLAYIPCPTILDNLFCFSPPYRLLHTIRPPSNCEYADSEVFWSVVNYQIHVDRNLKIFYSFSHPDRHKKFSCFVSFYWQLNFSVLGYRPNDHGHGFEESINSICTGRSWIYMYEIVQAWKLIKILPDSNRWSIGG